MPGTLLPLKEEAVVCRLLKIPLQPAESNLKDPMSSVFTLHQLQPCGPPTAETPQSLLFTVYSTHQKQNFPSVVLAVLAI